MDETFSFRAPPVPLRHRVDRRVVKGIAAASVLLLALTMFSRWVIDSERRSEARAAATATEGSLIGMMQGAPVEEVPPSPLSEIDAPARADARAALEAAREALHGRGTVADAGPGQLGVGKGPLIFTDGPSPAAGIVSVASAGQRWAAAVMGGSGTCYWIALDATGASYGTGDPCTGLAALSASDPGWR